MDKLQRVLNAAARVVTGTRKFDRGLGQILLDELHWLDVTDRVFFKLVVIVHRCLNGRAPLYLSDYCVPAAGADIGDSCVPATVNFLQYHVTGSILMVARPFQLPDPQSGTLSRILSGTRPSVQTVSDACLIHNGVDECSQRNHTDIFAQRVRGSLTTTEPYKSTYLA